MLSFRTAVPWPWVGPPEYVALVVLVMFTFPNGASVPVAVADQVRLAVSCVVKAKLENEIDVVF